MVYLVREDEGGKSAQGSLGLPTLCILWLSIAKSEWPKKEEFELDFKMKVGLNL